jgi:hypothetical protein
MGDSLKRTNDLIALPAIEHIKRQVLNPLAICALAPGNPDHFPVWVFLKPFDDITSDDS